MYTTSLGSQGFFLEMFFCCFLSNKNTSLCCHWTYCGFCISMTAGKPVLCDVAKGAITPARSLTIPSARLSWPLTLLLILFLPNLHKVGQSRRVLEGSRSQRVNSVGLECPDEWSFKQSASLGHIVKHFVWFFRFVLNKSNSPTFHQPLRLHLCCLSASPRWRT